MKKIFLILCLGVVGFSRISLAAGETGQEIANIKKNAENHGNILTDTSSSGNIINGIGMYGQQAHLTSLT